MASLKILFLGVYASGGIIRLLFLPLCYLILLSPFTLAIAYYFGLQHTVHKFLPEDFSLLDLLPQLVLSTVFILLPTRLLSGSRNAPSSKDGGRTRRVQSLPYWIPGFRHLGSIVFGAEKWLKDVRDHSITAITSYKNAGAKHNIIFSDTLLDQVFEKWNYLEEPHSYRWALVCNAFGMPTNIGQDQYFALSTAITKITEAEIFKGAPMQNLIEQSLNIVSESLPDFVTFNSSLVDQMQWERVANVELTDGTSEAECDLFILLNEFCCNAILPPIMGIQFTESYQLLATDLMTFNQRFWALALGLPRLSPIQGLPGAALAQKRLLYNLTNLFYDLSNPTKKRVPADDESVSGEETDADVSTPFVKLNELFASQELPTKVRAAIALQLVQSIVADIVPMVFWTLIHVYSSTPQDPHDSASSPLWKIKEETKSWVQAIQPPSIHPSFPAPPEIRYTSVTGAFSPRAYPYLQSCINESRRLYNSSISTYKIIKPITLEEKGIARPGEQEQWELDVGSYIDIGLSRNLINSSPANHMSPLIFKPDRFITTPASSAITCPTDPAGAYKSALLTSIIAGIVQLWEIAPAPKKSFFEHMQEAGAEASIGAAALSGEQKAAKEAAQKEKRAKEKKRGTWAIPKAVDGAEVKVPKADIRVRVRRREGLPTTKVVGRIG